MNTGGMGRRIIKIETGGGVHSVEGVIERKEKPDTKIHLRIPPEPRRLPEDVEAVLYGDIKSNIAPSWRSRVTLALTQGDLPEGMTEEEIILKVRRERG